MPQHIASQTVEAGKPMNIVTNQTARYSVTCSQSGTRVEFVALAGQAFTITSQSADVVVGIEEVLSFSQERSLQLVAQQDEQGATTRT
jgi:hypothetical protein